jgi:phosphatidylglycerophosphatase A
MSIAAVIASFFGVGLIPIVPATWASAVAAVLAWFIDESFLVYWAAGLSVAGLWACREAQTVFNSKDPKQFVMDEVCGMFLSVLWLPKSVPLFIAAFLLFRVLDVWKPWPISKIQDSKHPWSIMGDDLAAGLVTNLILQALTLVVYNHRI